jgi:hypothetical protein
LEAKVIISRESTIDRERGTLLDGCDELLDLLELVELVEV